MEKAFGVSSEGIDDFKAKISLSRIGQPFYTDRFAFGPQYVVDLGWTEEPTQPSYNSYAALSRPYTSGWVGYGLKTPYSDQLQVALEASFFNKRLNAAVSLYSRTNKDMVLKVPVAYEYGYTGKHASGLEVNNKGVDLQIQAVVAQNSTGVNWQTGLNLNMNRNALLALPEDRQEITINNRKLKIGESVDRFWLFQNEGIYETDADVPVNPSTGAALDFNGIPIQAGDPAWNDLNGDYSVNDQDRVLTGHMMPTLMGGWNNTLSYKNFDLSFHLAFALGQSALNTRVASQYDFINGESSNNLNAVKEIFFWQENVDTDQYPQYNPWSAVVPYRAEQDLFLEDASYAKLRSLSIGYDLSRSGLFKDPNNKIKRLYLYATGTNLLTFTSFSGADPELVTMMGKYDGYGLPIPKSFSLGIKLDL